MIYDTIAAISTALSESAISIVRLSGSDAIEIANSITSRDLTKQAGNTIYLSYIVDPDTKEEIDQVLISVFKDKKSFTGEDLVEINCHGGIYITKQILTLVLSRGARMAKRGEFMQRAFLHGKIDLTQAEAINDMITSKDSGSSKIAMQGMKGSVSKLIHPFLDTLLDIIANIEVNIDYPEYDDVEQLTNDNLLPRCEELLKDINIILKKAKSGKIMSEGVKCAIVGKPNVGKSSLLNALLEEEKAIVTDIEGTTRDIVEGLVRLEDVTLHLIDTAGIRESEDVVEQIGIERSKQAIDEAELVLVLMDGSKEIDEQDQELLDLTKDKNRILVYNKLDLMEESKDGVCISASKGEIEPLIKTINTMYEEHKFALNEATLHNERQISLMVQAKNHMEDAIHAMKDGLELDLVTIDLQASYNAMKEILGEVSRDDLLDTLFSKFCLGK